MSDQIKQQDKIIKELENEKESWKGTMKTKESNQTEIEVCNNAK